MFPFLELESTAMSPIRPVSEIYNPIPQKQIAGARAPSNRAGTNRLSQDHRKRDWPLSKDMEASCITIGTISMVMLALIPIVLLFLLAFLNPDVLMIPITPN